MVHKWFHNGIIMVYKGVINGPWMVS